MKKLYATLLLVWLAFPSGALADLPNPGRAKKIQSQTGFDSLNQPLEAIFKWLIIFIPTVAAFYLILSGYRYIVAQGNQELTEKAKKSLLYAVYGFIIAVVSTALIIVVSRGLGFNVGL